MESEGGIGEKIVFEVELRQMKKVLQALGFLEKNEFLTMKGKFCSQVRSCDEILITECVFRGVFNGLEEAEAVGILSLFVNEERATQQQKGKSQDQIKRLPARM